MGHRQEGLPRPLGAGRICWVTSLTGANTGSPPAHFASNKVSGASGCNSYSASYTVDGNSFGGPYEVTGDTITLGPLASTPRACADDAVQTQEQQYFAALALATTYQVTGNRLELFRADGGIAVSFEAHRTR